MCTYYASDNNGAGYKERADYASLICGEPIDFLRDFYEIAGDTVTFNASTPTCPDAFRYAAVKPWERGAQGRIRHVVIADDVSYVPERMLHGMTGLETVRQPAAVNRKLVDAPGCRHYIGGVYVPGAFVSWDGKLVGVREDVEEYRVLSNIREICSYAFANCPSLKRVILPENVAKIEEGTFDGFTDELTICCEASERPEGWAEGFAPAEGPRIMWGCRCS